jgi:Tol biopolymer transport system component
MIGKTLGHYEITSQLGKGGMGEVYQAKDLKLGRDVAIKVLPEEFAKDPDRVARFQREATLLASLNHPNIAAIYGLEESGGTDFLVLELVEGQTLRDRIKSGPIPAEEALKLALQIAEALEAAHEKGIIHRDLKPGNIKVTPEGKVKVLDFGLAKAFTGEQTDLNLSNSPTLSEAATQHGVILGTAAYMSPEQARGESVDKKADIWAFGCVLFEMLTGHGTFEGRTVSDVLASVIKVEPAWNRLPPNLHPRIRLLIERCLEKESKNRCSGIGEARADIQKALADPSGILVQPVTTVEPQRKLRLVMPWIAAALVLGAIIAGVAVWNFRKPEAGRVVRFEYELPEDQQIAGGLTPGIPLAVSPDGNQFVYGTTEGLYLRRVDALDARLIAGTDRSSCQPFFSPDGQWIGYWSQLDRKLKKVAISGGASVALCDTGTTVNGTSWDSDNTIVYADYMGSDILRISANGGTPESLIKEIPAKTKEGLHPSVPQMFPDGKTILFTNALDPNGVNTQIVVQSLKSEERKVVLNSGSEARYLPTGHIVYGLTTKDNYNLFAVPFDLDRLEVTGSPVSLLEGVAVCAFSNSGTLAYITGTGLGGPTTAETLGLPLQSNQRTLVWVDRKGKEEPLAAQPDKYCGPTISPDGTKVAMTIGYGGGKAEIWIWDIVRETMTRLTFNEAGEYPLWSRDGQRIAFWSFATEAVYWKAADGIGEDEKLGSVPGQSILPWSWSGDGKTLVTRDGSPTVGENIGSISIEGDHERRSLLQEKYNEGQPEISPDGRWMAYTSNESGKNEIYVRPFPEVNKGGRWQISTAGGGDPLWSPNGRELFYRNGDAVMAVAVEIEPTFKVGKPETLFRGTYIPFSPLEGHPWDISRPDGKRFLMLKEVASTVKPAAAKTTQKINIVVNWFEELKQRVPVK